MKTSLTHLSINVYRKLLWDVIITGTLSKVFAKELQKYYTRKGNRIIFSNGMTLNELALEMWEKLNYKGIDPSSMSRILSGERRFTPRQLEIFSSILEVSQSKKLRLMSYLCSDILSKYGIEEISNKDASDIVEFLKRDYKKIKKSVAMAVPALAKDMSEETLGLIDILVPEVKNANILKEIKNVKALILIEYVDSLFGQINEDELYRYVYPHILEIRKIGTEIRDLFIYKTSYTLEASLESLSGNHQKTQKAFNRGLKNVELDEFQTITAHKSVIVSMSKLGRSLDMESYAKSVLNMVNKLSESFQIVVLQSNALVRSKAADLSGAGNYLEKAWEIYNKLDIKDNSFKAARKLGIVKTEFLISLENSGFRSKSYLERLGNSSIEIAGLNGYNRVKEQLVGYLNKMQ